MSNTIYDRATNNWFKKYPTRQTTVCKCEKCGLFYKPTLGHKCKNFDVIGNIFDNPELLEVGE